MEKPKVVAVDSQVQERGASIEARPELPIQDQALLEVGDGR
jgi:hypothetical protein